MTNQYDTKAMLESCFSSTVDLFEGLAEADWATPSLCPDWDVRGVLIHLAGIESVLLGWMPESVETPLPFDRLGEFIAAADGLSNDELLARSRDLFEQRAADVQSMSGGQFVAPSMTPVGPGTYDRFMNVRVFDFWVHQRDVATPLGLELDNSGPAAELSMDEVHNSLGYIVGKKVGLPEGKSIQFTTTGGVERSMAVVVDGRATVVDAADAPDTTVTADSLAFMQLACGRIDPQGAIDAGDISWVGDAEWGERAARNLRFTM